MTDVLGIELPAEPSALAECGTMQRLSDVLYKVAGELRAADYPIAASAVEHGAFHLINEAHGLQVLTAVTRDRETT